MLPKLNDQKVDKLETASENKAFELPSLVYWIDKRVYVFWTTEGLIVFLLMFWDSEDKWKYTVNAELLLPREKWMKYQKQVDPWNIAGCKSISLLNFAKDSKIWLILVGKRKHIIYKDSCKMLA